MAKTSAVTVLKQELREARAKVGALEQALRVLGGLDGGGTKTPSAGRTRRRGRKMSAAARKRLSKMTKRRWAAARKAGKKTLKG
jgi:hypothetical protein